MAQMMTLENTAIDWLGPEIELGKTGLTGVQKALVWVSGSTAKTAYQTSAVGDPVTVSEEAKGLIVDAGNELYPGLDVLYSGAVMVEKCKELFK